MCYLVLQPQVKKFYYNWTRIKKATKTHPRPTIIYLYICIRWSATGFEMTPKQISDTSRQLCIRRLTFILSDINIFSQSQSLFFNNPLIFIGYLESINLLFRGKCKIVNYESVFVDRLIMSIKLAVVDEIKQSESCFRIK